MSHARARPTDRPSAVAAAVTSPVWVGAWVANFVVLYAAYAGYGSFAALGVPPGI